MLAIGGTLALHLCGLRHARRRARAASGTERMSGAPLSVLIYAAAAVRPRRNRALWHSPHASHLLRRILSLNVLSAAVFLMLVALARRERRRARPIRFSMPWCSPASSLRSAPARSRSSLMRRIHDLTGTAHLPDSEPDDG